MDDRIKDINSLIQAAEAAGVAADNLERYKKGLLDSSTQAETLSSLMDEISQNVGTASQFNKESLEHERERINVTSQILQFSTSHNVVLRQNTEELLQQNATRQKQLKMLEEESQKISEATSNLIKQKESLISIRHYVAGIKDIWSNMSKETARATLFDGMKSGAMAVFDFLKDLLFKYDAAYKKMQTEIGSTTYNQSVKQVQGAALAANISIEELTESTVSLHEGFSGLSQQSQKVQKNLIYTNALMAKLGFSSETFAASMDMSTKALGKTPAEAQNFLTSLRSFGKEAGISSKRLSSQLQSSLSSLAAYGPRAERSFKELALAAKNTGVEVDKLMAVTEKFSTFEGASEAAGSLNAMLGGNFVNSMDLMKASLEGGTGSIEILQKAVKASGKDFSEMSTPLKKAIAEAAGFSDVADAAKAMNNEILEGADALDAQAMSTKQLEAENRKNQSLEEAKAKALESLATNLKGVADVVNMAFRAFKKFRKALTDKDGALGSFGPKLWKALQYAIPLGVALGFVVFKIGQAAAHMAVLKAAIFGASKDAAKLGSNMPPRAGPSVGPSPGASSKVSGFAKIGKTLGSAVLPLLAFGAAMLMAGKGIQWAAQGLKVFVMAFKELNPKQAKMALIGMGIGFGALVAALLALSLLGPAVVTPLLAIAAAAGIFAGIIHLMKDDILDLKDVIIDLATLFADKLLKGFEMILKSLPGLAPLIDKARKAAVQLIGAFKSFLESALKQVLPYFDRLLVFLEMAIILVGDVIDKALARMPPIIDAIGRVMKKVAPYVRDIVKIIGDSFVAVIKELIGYLKTVVDIVSSTVIVVIDTLAAAVVKMVEGGLQIFKEMWMYLIDNLPKLQGIIQTLAPAIELFASAFDKIAAAVQTAVEAIKIIAEGFRTFMGDLKEIIPLVNEFVSMVADKFVAILKQAGDSLAQFVDAIGPVFQAALKVLLSEFKDMVQYLGDKVVSVIDKVLEFGRAILNLISVDGVRLMHGAANAFEKMSDAASKFIKTFAEAPSHFYQGMKDIGNYILNFPLSGLEKIISLMERVHSLFIKPINSTLSSAMNSVIDKIKNLTSQQMAAIMTISQMDIDSESGALRTAAKRKANADINININMPVIMDGREFKDIIRQAVNNQVAVNADNAGSVNVRLRS